MKFLLLAIMLFSFDKGDVSLKVEAETDSTKIDLARSFFVEVKVEGAPSPDLNGRFVGFSARGYEIAPGVSRWLLEPKPGEKRYKILPFAVGKYRSEAFYFQNPDPIAPQSGGMIVKAKRDISLLDMKFWQVIFLVFSGGVAALLLVIYLFRHITHRVKEFFMSPIERAYAELARLQKTDLIKKGLFKDYYVELTLVVRRYIQRKFNIRAPHMTTEEFLQCSESSEELREFLESADMIKFAGAMADEKTAEIATENAKNYLKTCEERGLK